MDNSDKTEQLTADNEATSAVELTQAAAAEPEALRGDAAAPSAAEPAAEHAKETKTRRNADVTRAFSERLNARAKDLEAKYLDDIKTRDEQLAGLRNEYEQKSPTVLKAQEIIRQNTVKSDMEAIKAAYPEADVSDVQKLGKVFLELMATGKVDAVTAYEAQMSHDSRTVKPAPASMGSAASSGQSTAKEYYSPDEVDSLSNDDYDRDPDLWQRVRKSMLKWKY